MQIGSETSLNTLMYLSKQLGSVIYWVLEIISIRPPLKHKAPPQKCKGVGLNKWNTTIGDRWVVGGRWWVAGGRW